jgi:TolB protein
LITTFSPPGGKASPNLADWSGDGGHALFYAMYSTPPTATSIDMHTGSPSTIPLGSTDGGGIGTVRYTRPNGTAILVSTGFNGSTPGTLRRVDLTGQPQLSYPTDQLGGAGQFSGDYLESADGTQLVLATANLGNQLVPRSDNSLVVVRNDGTIVRALPTPMPEARCSPVRWWTAAVVLAHCTSLKTSANQLWEVPLDGSPPTPLTAVNSAQEDDPGFGPDLGDVDAWALPGGTFLQSEGACGSSFLSRMTGDGHSTRVTVPSVDNQNSVRVVGVAGDNSKLVLTAALNCGPGTALLTYDPSANTSTVLLGPQVNGGSVIAAREYPAR